MAIVFVSEKALMLSTPGARLGLLPKMLFKCDINWDSSGLKNIKSYFVL